MSACAKSRWISHRDASLWLPHDSARRVAVRVAEAAQGTGAGLSNPYENNLISCLVIESMSTASSTKPE
jgi:hypothetical protein